ncbi:hypothetical protein PFISCL1PPCAC_6810, partial [Pristionchus fissidentatus]
GTLTSLLETATFPALVARFFSITSAITEKSAKQRHRIPTIAGILRRKTEKMKIPSCPGGRALSCIQRPGRYIGYIHV